MQSPLDSVRERSDRSARVDPRVALGVVAVVGVTAALDERIADWWRSSAVQGDSGRSDLVHALTVVNEVPLTIAAVATYGIGRLTGSRAVTDVGAHVTVSLVVTELLSEAVRIGLGRTRPRANPDDAFDFQPGQGLTHFEQRSFPSLHASVAFTTAAALIEEMRLRDLHARRYLAPLLLGLATVPGFTRLYLDQHWSSDVIAGSALGALVGTQVVRRAHHRRTRLERVVVIPIRAGDGHAILVGVSVPH
jgi:membrane-associated phospholipid phosphatase